jgi:hypothetical protein
MHEGWYLVAFESDVEGELTAVVVGDQPLVLVEDHGCVRAFDATCPHRGANLAFGGRLDGDGIVCPFHGKHIFLGLQPAERYCVREYPVLGYGGMFFVLLSDEHENGLGALLAELAADHVFAPSFATTLEVAADLVIENAFDETHFRPTHGVRNSPELSAIARPGGPFVAEGVLEVPVSLWQQSAGDTVEIPYAAHAFSPHLVFSRMGGDHPYWVITGTTPIAGGCVVRQAIAVPANGNGRASVDPERLAYLANQSKAGLDQDRVIWEHLRPPKRPLYSPDDATMLAFRKFSRGFWRDD